GAGRVRQRRDRVYRQCHAHDQQQSRRGHAEWDDDGGGGGGGGELRDAQHQQCGRGLHAPGGVGGVGGRDQRDIRHQLGCLHVAAVIVPHSGVSAWVGIDEVVTRRLLRLVGRVVARLADRST